MPVAIPISLELERTMAAAMTTGARVTGLLVAGPFLGSAAVPPRIKAGLAVLLVVFLAPLVREPVLLPTPTDVPLLAGEFVVGFLLGFMLQIIFEAGQIAGQVCGLQMGYSLASIINPDSQADSTVLSTFCQLMLLFLFVQLGVPRWLIRGLARSYEYLPPGQFALREPVLRALLQFAAGMFVAGLQIAAPVLVACLFADVALGFIGKASPQLPVLFVGISIKNLLGLTLMCGAVTFWPSFFEARFAQALDASERILKLAR